MNFLIPVLVGSIIGYFTNWLAIKMLFRPHYEKKFMGITLPFTPGLIPKERARISNSIGEAVGEHLLSPDVITRALSSPETNEQIKLWIYDGVNRLRDSGKSIQELLEGLPGSNYKELVLLLKRELINIILTQIKSQRFKEKILGFFEEKLKQEQIYEIIKEKLGEFIDQFAESDKIKIEIQKNIEYKFDKLSNDDRTIKEIFSENIILSVNKYLDENIKGITNTVKELVNSPDIQKKLRIWIADMVDQNVSRLITSFISPSSISEKIIGAIDKYMDDENIDEDILGLIRVFLDKVLEAKSSEITPKLLSSISVEEISDQIINYIINKENLNKLIDIVDKELRTSDKEKFMVELSKSLDNVLNSDELDRSISLFVDDIVKDLMNKSVPSVLEGSHDNLLQIYEFGKVIFDNFARNELPNIVKIFNVSKIVEDNINEFDVEFTEELILDIANKELKTITWLGALLGGIMGLLSPLLQML